MRTINEIIIHCTATPEGRDVTVDEIDRWHKARGYDGCGYHYVVYRDGCVMPGPRSNARVPTAWATTGGASASVTWAA